MSYYVYIARFMPRVEIVQKQNSTVRRLYIQGHNGKVSKSKTLLVCDLDHWFFCWILVFRINASTYKADVLIIIMHLHVVQHAQMKNTVHVLCEWNMVLRWDMLEIEMALVYLGEQERYMYCMYCTMYMYKCFGMLFFLFFPDLSLPCLEWQPGVPESLGGESAAAIQHAQPFPRQG